LYIKYNWIFSRHIEINMPNWRITAIINFPIAIVEDAPPAPGSFFPQKVKPISRISQKIFQEVKGIPISLEPCYSNQFPPCQMWA
jgi:hypothetical protein